MTQDEVLSALHKVVAENMNYTTWTVSTPHLVALVNLAIEQEREACAKVCDQFPDVGYVDKKLTVDYHSYLIRAKGQA
jgi:hypothetical protein